MQPPLTGAHVNVNNTIKGNIDFPFYGKCRLLSGKASLRFRTAPINLVQSGRLAVLRCDDETKRNKTHKKTKRCEHIVVANDEVGTGFQTTAIISIIALKPSTSSTTLLLLTI